MLEFDFDWLYRQIVDNSHDAIIFADRQGIVRLWNLGAEEMFGFTAIEALGQSLDLIVPEKNRRPHWEGYRKVMASGVTGYAQKLLAVPAIRKDGTRISIEFSIVLVRSRDGEVVGSAAIMRDVTERRKKELALK
ncbi:MAG: PAS domain S-box protein [Syntrophobacteraceae bacterium]|jgi:PAS domain S-box-containing protein